MFLPCLTKEIFHNLKKKIALYKCYVNAKHALYEVVTIKEQLHYKILVVFFKNGNL